jgi:hypothetical protein
MLSLWQTKRNNPQENEIVKSSAVTEDEKKQGGFKIARS